jgi:hypothetical protein
MPGMGYMRYEEIFTGEEVTRKTGLDFTGTM